MANRGRPRKSGARYPNGKLKPPTEQRMAATPELMQRKAFYTDTASSDLDNESRDGRAAVLAQTVDPIGRAYLAGLLGENAEKKRDLGRVIEAQYWGWYDTGHDEGGGVNYFARARANPLARFQPMTGFGRPETPAEKNAREAAREKALNDALTKIGRPGSEARRYFDELVIDPYPDQGPAWLDRIITARKAGAQPSPRDLKMLTIALHGLERII